MWQLLQAVQANNMAQWKSAKIATSDCIQNYDTQLIILVMYWFRFSYTSLVFSRANIYAQAQASTQSEVIIRISCCFISKHYLFKPFKLTELANVWFYAKYNCLRDFPIQFVNNVCSFRPYLDSRQSSQSLFGAPDLMSFLPEPFFSYCISFIHGVNASICFRSHDASLSFLLNLPRTISLDLSHITVVGTLSCWNRRDSAWQTSLFTFIGNKHDQPKSVAKIFVHLLPLLDNVVANSISLYTLCSDLLYHNWQLFDLNCIDKDGYNTVWIPCCVVQWIIFNAFLGEIPQLLARTKWSSPGTFPVWTFATHNDKVVS